MKGNEARERERKICRSVSGGHRRLKKRGEEPLPGESVAEELVAEEEENDDYSGRKMNDQYRNLEMELRMRNEELEARKAALLNTANELLVCSMHTSLYFFFLSLSLSISFQPKKTTTTKQN